jgi:hypothetical protein
MPEQFLVRGVTLNYTVGFENVDTATAPAQEVVVTDQLDTASLDLTTFRLGPMAFGDIVVTPAAGVSDYTGGVDLRPDQNLMVLIAASLDEETGVATWRFTSVDPDTLELTEDPLAGFLPPNANPPEGEGSVTFSVEQKPELVSGTTICNDGLDRLRRERADRDARVVQHDRRDAARERSRRAGSGTGGPTFRVEWAGTDAHSGVGVYDVFVSVDGGPFTLWLDDTLKTSAVYVGEPGKTYAFYTVAIDNVGNVEAEPGTPDATTTPLGGCSRPVTTGASPTASDCLFVLRTAVGSETCSPECVCDVNGDGSSTAVDALVCLKKAVGQDVTLGCECPIVTTTTTSTTTTSTTLPSDHHRPRPPRRCSDHHLDDDTVADDDARSCRARWGRSWRRAALLILAAPESSRCSPSCRARRRCGAGSRTPSSRGRRSSAR